MPARLVGALLTVAARSVGGARLTVAARSVGGLRLIVPLSCWGSQSPYEWTPPLRQRAGSPPA